MVRMYYGKIGGGKTYLVLFQEIIPALRAGRRVITNIDLHFDALRNYIGRDINIRIIKNLQWYRDHLTLIIDGGYNQKKDATPDYDDSSVLEGKKELNPALCAGDLIVCDEAQFIWDSRDFKDTSKGFNNLMEYNRHFGVDIVFITQNPKRLEANCSRLTNDAYQIKNLGFLGGFLQNKFAVLRRQNPGDKDVISQSTITYDKSLFSLYDSGTKQTISGKSFFMKKQYLFFLVFGIISIVFLFRNNPLDFKKLMKKNDQKGGLIYESASSSSVGVLPPVPVRQVGPSSLPELSYKPNEKNSKLVITAKNVFSSCVQVSSISIVSDLKNIDVKGFDCGGDLYQLRDGKDLKLVRGDHRPALAQVVAPNQL